MWHFDKCRLGRAFAALCLVSSLTIIEYSSDEQRLRSDCADAQADLRLCWSHIPHCWKLHALAYFVLTYNINWALERQADPTFVCKWFYRFQCKNIACDRQSNYFGTMKVAYSLLAPSCASHQSVCIESTL